MVGKFYCDFCGEFIPYPGGLRIVVLGRSEEDEDSEAGGEFYDFCDHSCLGGWGTLVSLDGVEAATFSSEEG